MAGKILIVDDVSTNRIVMKVKLAAAGYLPILAGDGAACLDAAARELPDLILLDLMLPDMSGIRVLELLRAMPQLKSVPVVMFSANQSLEARLDAFRAGADDFLTKPIDDQILLARLRGLLRSRSAVATSDKFRNDAMTMLGLAEPSAPYVVPASVALVVAKPATSARLQKDIAALTPHRISIITKEEALSAVGQPHDAPEIYLIEADLAVASDGLRLMSELNSREHSRFAGFSVLVNPMAPATAAMAYDLGANDVMLSIAPAEEVALRVERLVRRKRESDTARASVQDGLRLAMIDSLTGMHNRRFGLAQLQAVAASADLAGDCFSVLVADLDSFKSVNDRYGHSAGDAVLIEIANRLTSNLRLGDLVSRIGGEEFLIVLPHTSLDQAQLIAKRLCQAVEEQPIRVNGDPKLHVTVSIGLAVNGPNQAMLGVSEIIDRADRALLMAKSAGRNRVTVGRSAA